VRKSSAFLTAIVAASAITVAWRIGDVRANEQHFIGISPVPSPSVFEPTVDPGAEPTIEPGNTPTPSKAGGTNLESKPSKTNKPTAPVEKTVKSDVVNYKYGIIQIAVTALVGKVTQISVVQGESSNGRAAAYKELTAQLIESQGQSYGNVSGATFTTEAFIRAYNSAVSKF
jgi:uncharacterized protein with FMN-binding domain